VTSERSGRNEPIEKMPASGSLSALRNRVRYSDNVPP
jgi:hypothetical protein